MLPENKEAQRTGPVTREDPSPRSVIEELIEKRLVSEEEAQMLMGTLPEGNRTDPNSQP